MSWLLRTPDPAAMAASVADRPIKADPFRPSAPAFYGQATARNRRPRMSSDIRYALVRKPTDPACKPVAHASLAALVQAIHRDRGGDSLQTFDAQIEIEVDGALAPRKGVSIFATAEGERSRYLGWAYLNGRSAAALRAALEVATPDVPVVGRKAA